VELSCAQPGHLVEEQSVEQQPSSSPLLHDAVDAAPFVIAHGDRDSYLPVSGAQALQRKLLTESSAPVVYAQLPGGQHGFDLFRSLRFDAVIAGIETFTAHILAQPRSGNGTPHGGMLPPQVATEVGVSVWPPENTAQPSTSQRPRSLGLLGSGVSVLLTCGHYRAWSAVAENCELVVELDGLRQGNFMALFVAIEREQARRGKP
jgi:hypothetical protein